ncbi:UNVERIFIED_CONTAM: peptidyl-prolyl cis-trans isomerase C [Acidovorax defluvii]
MKTHSLRFGGLAALVMVLSAPVVYAAEAVLMDGGQVTITEQDMHADALRMPLEMRERVLARPDQVAQIASNLYVRRSLAQQADAAGLASNPETKAALQIARDKVLSDALLAKIDKDNALPDAKLEGLARSNYNANPDRFKVAEQVQVRHILIASPDDAGRAKAAQVLVDLQGGADFAALAKEYSADPGSAAKGGELGFFAKGAMVPEFDEASFALQKKGELSGLVKTKFGYHILQLEDRRPAGVRPFEEVRDDLIKGARATVQQEARALAAQKAQQGVTVHKEAIEAFAAGYKSAP